MSLGLGIELGEQVLRSVVLDLDDPTGIVANEFPIDPDDDGSVLDALVRATAAIDTAHRSSVPLRIAAAPAEHLMQAIDVTGRPRFEIVALADQAAAIGAADSMMIVDDGRRRRLGLVRGHAASSSRLTGLARRVGLGDVRVEPAPMSLGRVLPDGRFVVRRTVDAQTSWQAAYDGGFPISATTAPAGLAGWPAIAAFAAPPRHEDPETVLDADELAAHVDDFADRARSRRANRTGLDADGWPLDPPTLTLGGDAHPSFPDHDLRAAGRLGVALGAAAGAAGLPERHLRVERLTPLRHPGPPTRLPWAIELVTPAATAIDPPTADLRPVTTGRRARRGAGNTGPSRDRRIARRYRRSR